MSGFWCGWFVVCGGCDVIESFSFLPCTRNVKWQNVE